MGRVSSAGDNAAIESFYALLQNNVLDRHRWTTRSELRYAIIYWIDTPTTAGAVNAASDDSPPSNTNSPSPTQQTMRHKVIITVNQTQSSPKDRYAHLFPEHGTALADRLDAFIAAATPTPAGSTSPLIRPR